MSRKSAAAFAAISLIMAPIVASCGESITGSLGLDIGEGDSLLYTDLDGTVSPLESTDSVFDPSITAHPTYVAPGNSELPQKIKTAVGQKAGYHFSGWAQIDASGKQISDRVIPDFTAARMPYSPVLYRTVFKKEVSVVFRPVDDTGADFPLDPIVFAGADYYAGQTISSGRLGALLAQFNDALSPDWEARGHFDGVYEKRLTGDPLANIVLDDTDMVLYVRFATNPTLAIHYGNDTPDSVFYVPIGTPLDSYLPDEDPVKENAVFDGWYEDPSFDVPFSFSSFAIMPSQRLDIYAHYLNCIPLSFAIPEDGAVLLTAAYEEAIGGDGTVRVTEGETLETELLGTATKSTANFLFWYYDADGDGQYESTGDVAFDHPGVMVPLGLTELELTAAFDEWPTLYIDLGPDYAKIIPAPALELIPVADEADGVFAVKLDFGAPLAAYIDLDSYTLAEDIALAGFTVVKPASGETIRTAASESPLDGITVMPDKNLILRAKTSDRYRIVLHLFGGDTPVALTASENPIGTFDAAPLLLEADRPVASTEGYLADVQSGWAFDESLTDLAVFPLEITGDLDLWPVMAARKVRLEFASEDPDQPPLLKLEGINGQALPIAEIKSLYETAYPDRQLKGFTMASTGAAVSALDKFPEANETYLPILE